MSSISGGAAASTRKSARGSQAAAPSAAVGSRCAASIPTSTKSKSPRRRERQRAEQRARRDGKQRALLRQQIGPQEAAQAEPHCAQREQRCDGEREPHGQLRKHRILRCLLEQQCRLTYGLWIGHRAAREPRRRGGIARRCGWRRGKCGRCDRRRPPLVGRWRRVRLGGHRG
eukprot:scaffold237485_cov24-Tisochrysis_lutea.AAC.5